MYSCWRTAWKYVQRSDKTSFSRVKAKLRFQLWIFLTRLTDNWLWTEEIKMYCVEERDASTFLIPILVYLKARNQRSEARIRHDIQYSEWSPVSPEPRLPVRETEEADKLRTGSTRGLSQEYSTLSPKTFKITFSCSILMSFCIDPFEIKYVVV